MLKPILRDPLLHFLVVAIGLFVLHDIFVHEDDSGNARQIVVDRDALLNFIQYRSKSFDQQVAERQLASLTDDELDKIITELVREEALAREARALGLDKDDYVIKRRLVQKVDYVARGFADAAFKVTEEDIRAYFEENRADFYIQPRITFTHVFFSNERNGADHAEQLAAETLIRLREEGANFEEAGPERLREFQTIGGVVPSPFDCWLLFRSLSTLSIRVKTQSENAAAIAKMLNSHHNIERVFYPGIESHPNHNVAAKQMNGSFGGMLSVLVKGGEAEALKFTSKLQLFKHATSLGGVESLVEHRLSVEGDNAKSPPNLIRISVGIEHVDDLIDDLKVALG